MRYELAILDLDGVVYIGPDAVPHAIPALNALADAGTRLMAATNNANRSSDVVARHLQELGLKIDSADVMTSAQAAASYLARELGPGAEVLAVGGEGVAASLEEAGLRPVRASADLALSAEVAQRVPAVVTGYGPMTAWYDIACAHWAIVRGARWVATNVDPSVPTPYGFAPGNGAFVGLLERSTGVQPDIMGKPKPTLFSEAVQRAGASSAIVVGDRLDTDVDGANAAGLESLLVFTGVNDTRDLALQAPSAWPGYVARDLRSLDQPTVVLQWDGSRVTAHSDHPVVQSVLEAANQALGLPARAGAVAKGQEPSPLIDCRVLRTVTL